MEEIDLFDKYITENLSETEMAEFRSRLESDDSFALNFRAYLLAVRGICQEAQQDDIDFGIAMKSISREQLQSIIGKREKPRILRQNFLRRNAMWISSMAAMLVVAIGVGWSIYTSSQARLCDTVYNLSYKPVTGDPRSVRGICKKFADLNTLTPAEIEAQLPELRAAFEADEIDSQYWHIDGMNLAMAYLKLHRKKDSIKTLEYLAAHSSEPDNKKEYTRIIDQLK